MCFLFQWLISGFHGSVKDLLSSNKTFIVSIRISTTSQIRSGAAMEIGESEGIGVDDKFAILY